MMTQVHTRIWQRCENLKAKMQSVKYSSKIFHVPYVLTFTVFVTVMTFLGIVWFKVSTLNSRQPLISYTFRKLDPAYFRKVYGRNIDATIDITESTPMWQEKLFQKTKNALVAGKAVEPGTKFLVIGIASVYRPENYLNQTLSSLIHESYEDERQDVVVVIYLADSPKNNTKQLALIQENFQEHLDSGFFQVIESSEEIYPPMDFVETQRTYNDSAERVLWRAKQVIDFAFLFKYSQPLAKYYLVMEDDVLSAPQCITAIRDYIDTKEPRRWVALEFTTFHCIGLLFHMKSIPKLMPLLFMYYQNQPVDVLLREFINLEVPEVKLIRRRNPSIFQHIGKNSTLPHKTQDLQDSTFGTFAREYKSHRNPEARITTTMRVYQDFLPYYPYKSTPGFFWGIPKPNATFDIVFPTPLNISRIVIISGRQNSTHLFDHLSSARLEVSASFVNMSSDNKSAICDSFRPVARFGRRSNGSIDYSISDGSGLSDLVARRRKKKHPNTVQCIRIRIGRDQKQWVVLREIQIFKSATLPNNSI